MARSFKRRSKIELMNKLDITPLMDLAFSLLIIFMISTPLMEQSIQINLPKQEPSQANKSADVEFQSISIDSNSEIFWGKQRVSIEELNALLGNLARNNNPPPISIRGDIQLHFQTFIDVVSTIKKHKLEKIHIDTEIVSKPRKR